MIKKYPPTRGSISFRLPEKKTIAKGCFGIKGCSLGVRQNYDKINRQDAPIRVPKIIPVLLFAFSGTDGRGDGRTDGQKGGETGRRTETK